MKIPRKSARFLKLTAELEAEFIRHGYPPIPGQCADYLADQVEAVATQLRVGPPHALNTYIYDDWPVTFAAAVVAQFKERDDAIADTPAVMLSHTEAINTVLSLGVVADWTLRHFAKDFREARAAMIATNALTELAGRIIRANGDEVTFGGSPLGNARVALIEAINLMTAPMDCACTDHERSTDRLCPSMATVGSTLLATLHLIGGVMPSADSRPMHWAERFLGPLPNFGDQ
jgi:hypothetical protein